MSRVRGQLCFLHPCSKQSCSILPGTGGDGKPKTSTAAISYCLTSAAAYLHSTNPAVRPFHPGHSTVLVATLLHSSIFTAIADDPQPAVPYDPFTLCSSLQFYTLLHRPPVKHLCYSVSYIQHAPTLLVLDCSDLPAPRGTISIPKSRTLCSSHSSTLCSITPPVKHLFHSVSYIQRCTDSPGS